MKAIFSTKYLAVQLEKALKNKGWNKIEFIANTWHLPRPEKQSIIIEADYIRNDRPERPSLNIDRAQWYRVMQFLKTLPEQPICLEMDCWDENEQRIELTQFIARF